MESAEEFNLLVIGDVQLSIRKVQLLRTQLQRAKRLSLVDLVLVTGNLLNLSRADRRNPERTAASEGDCATLLAAIEELTARVAYVGGTTDAPALFGMPAAAAAAAVDSQSSAALAAATAGAASGVDEADCFGSSSKTSQPQVQPEESAPLASVSQLCRLSNYSLNAHGQCIDLGRDLGIAIVGFGGATNGFPFTSREAMARAATASGGAADCALRAVKAGRQLLVLTHLGCVGSEVVEKLVSGAYAASGKVFPADAVVLSVCAGRVEGGVVELGKGKGGGTRAGAELTAGERGASAEAGEATAIAATEARTTTRTTEVNPGSLAQAGRYALVKLARSHCQPWRVAKVDLCSLT